jgi:hypothetical protein
LETICSHTANCALTGVACFIYDFQTLLTGIAAIAVAITAGIPVWKQLRDTNLQTRISHRETLASLLRDAVGRYEKVHQSIHKLLSMADDATADPLGEALPINLHDAHHLEQLFHGALDWYLVILADTEHPDIELRKSALRAALHDLVGTLGDAHWAEHNDQHDEDHSISDTEWAAILARCAEAKIDAADRVSDAQSAYRDLCQAQENWTQSLRNRIAKLDLQIAAH